VSACWSPPKQKRAGETGAQRSISVLHKSGDRPEEETGINRGGRHGTADGARRQHGAQFAPAQRGTRLGRRLNDAIFSAPAVRPRLDAPTIGEPAGAVAPAGSVRSQLWSVSQT
jgi:hypothetical protein